MVEPCLNLQMVYLLFVSIIEISWIYLPESEITQGRKIEVNIAFKGR